MHATRAHIAAALALAIAGSFSAPADAGKGRLDFDRFRGPDHGHPPHAEDWVLVDNRKSVV